MGCNSCGGGRGTVQPQRDGIQYRNIPVVQDCDYTRVLIQNWLNALQCVKDNNKLTIIGLLPNKANSYLGYLQSALNYADNYCFYYNKLQDYQLNILPRIITNVPECI